MKFSWSDQHAAWPDGHGIALKIKSECKINAFGLACTTWPDGYGAAIKKSNRA
jgi:hypothetical protein